jgi:hypothetical protein
MANTPKRAMIAKNFPTIGMSFMSMVLDRETPEAPLHKTLVNAEVP